MFSKSPCKAWDVHVDTYPQFALVDSFCLSFVAPVKENAGQVLGAKASLTFSFFICCHSRRFLFTWNWIVSAYLTPSLVKYWNQSLLVNFMQSRAEGILQFALTSLDILLGASISWCSTDLDVCRFENPSQGPHIWALLIKSEIPLCGFVVFSASLFLPSYLIGILIASVVFLNL